MKNWHTISVVMVGLSLAILTQSASEEFYYVCLPHKEEPCKSYRISTPDDVAHHCAFSFDPRELGCQKEEGCRRCWFKIKAAHRKTIYALLKEFPEKTSVKDMVAYLENNIPQGITPEDHREALVIIKKISNLSGGCAQAWHFTAWLAYERPLALKKTCR